MCTPFQCPPPQCSEATHSYKIPPAPISQTFHSSFSFQILSEIRHLIMDMGYGFELKTTRITGIVVIFGSVALTILIYLIGKNFI